MWKLETGMFENDEHNRVIGKLKRPYMVYVGGFFHKANIRVWYEYVVLCTYLIKSRKASKVLTCCCLLLDKPSLVLPGWITTTSTKPKMTAKMVVAK